ncbi:alpha/beta fold hydrolase [Sphingomonas sp.]|uniref:alpha/beta fold hydrolase n=1 Tax=Sphingomonas sp. TaxID=28214 RepID=UPI0026010122|nr:alpha/beta fold hydrolase [Sphingomonas sp.]
MEDRPRACLDAADADPHAMSDASHRLPMTVPTIHHWTASDGIDLAWRELGEGAPVILLHGLFSDGHVNWVKFGHAARIAATGKRVIIPDLRAHGLSGKPHDPAHYPPGVLGRDLIEFVAHLGFTSYDLGGFSLGARTTVQGIGEGLTPRRAILGGMGYEGLIRWASRSGFFLDAIALFDTARRGDPHWLAIQFMKTMKVDPIAATALLHSFEPAPDGWQAKFTMPTLVLCGADDRDNGSAAELADALPAATYAEVPGTHMSSVTEPAFGDALAAFLA